MAQPTLGSLVLNAGAGGSSLAVETVGGRLWQAVLVGYSTGDGTANIVTSDAPLPVKLAANSGVDVGDVDVLSMPPIPAGGNLIGKVSAGLDTAALYSGTTALTPVSLPIAKNASGPNELVPADAAKKIRVLAIVLYAAGTAVGVYLQSGTTAIFGGSATPLTLDKTGAAGMPDLCLPFNPLGWCETAVNEALNLNLSAGQYVGGVLVYVKV